MTNTPLPASQRVVQLCLFLFAAIGLFGGALQMYLGQPETTPRLDNVHRFMAGVYFSTGVIAFWAAMTVGRQSTLVFLLAFGVLIVTILVAGSLWIMANLNDNMMPPPELWLLPPVCGSDSGPIRDGSVSLQRKSLRSDRDWPPSER